MIEESRQGDIFEVGNSGNYQFILVFGHLGLNAMNFSWQSLKETQHSFHNIDDPFYELNAPTMFQNGKWIQFIAEHDNHGMKDTIFEEVLTDAFEWALEHELERIVTNGIKNSDYSMDTLLNRESDDRRVKLIQEICSRDNYSQLKITLISLDDAYLRNN